MKWNVINFEIQQKENENEKENKMNVIVRKLIRNINEIPAHWVQYDNEMSKFDDFNTEIDNKLLNIVWKWWWR